VYARIAGLGQWFPEQIRRNSDWPEEFRAASHRRQGDRTLVDLSFEGDSDRCRALAAKYLALESSDPFLGGTERRIASADESSADAETLAARAALADAGHDACDVDAIFSWALVPDRLMPSNACRVAHALDAKRAWALTVDAACASSVAQLALAAGLIESGRARSVLLTQSHLASRTFPLSHPASPCVGDGATALLVTAAESPGVQVVHSVTHGEYYEAVVWCRDKEAQRDTPWWEPGGAFFMGSHDAQATRVLMHDTIAMGVSTVYELAERAHFAVADIEVLATVQPRRWVPAAIAEGLGLPSRVAPQTYDRFAHLGGAGAVANLIAARDAGLLRKGALAVIYAQGAGFTRAAAAVRW
jgi:3-oxoacyl-[acyl-carrier-protein] synthase III